MGKTKNKEGSELSYLRGEVRRLKKLVKSLEQENRSLRKHEHMYEISQDEELDGSDEDAFVDLKKLIPCDGDGGCGKGFFRELELMGKLYGSCNTCGRHKRLK